MIVIIVIIDKTDLNIYKINNYYHYPKTPSALGFTKKGKNTLAYITNGTAHTIEE